MDIKAAQADSRLAFVGGGPGVIVSGLVWLTAAAVSQHTDVTTAFATLFFGGMLIVPVATLLERQVFRRPPPSKENALAAIGFETVFAMLGCLIAAYLLSPHAPDLVFPVAAIAIGTRYFTFSTLYGNRLYFILGGVIAAIGAVGIWGRFVIPGGVTLAVAMTEMAFGLLLTIISLRSKEGAH
jgi:hypothetical protein